MQRRKLKVKEVGPARDILLKTQAGLCPLCEGKMGLGKKQPVLDHDHSTGFLRDVLCRNCNGIEGKVFNLARRAKHNLTVEQWLSNLLAYYDTHKSPKHGGVLHPTHKTEAEKKLARNKKARLRRAALKKDG